MYSKLKRKAYDLPTKRWQSLSNVCSGLLISSQGINGIVLPNRSQSISRHSEARQARWDRSTATLQRNNFSAQWRFKWKVGISWERLRSTYVSYSSFQHSFTIIKSAHFDITGQYMIQFTHPVALFPIRNSSTQAFPADVRMLFLRQPCHDGHSLRFPDYWRQPC
jgi:hypothetical protein